MALNLTKDKCLPKHVAFIMDGNRRWAKKKCVPIIEGHRKGSNIIKSIVKVSLSLNIKYLTFFSFSTENWNRKTNEVIELQKLLDIYLDSQNNNFLVNKINFKVIGDLDKFTSTTKKKIIKLEQQTSSFNKLFFVLALSYGSRTEIIAAINKILQNKIKKISEKDLSSFLMTKNYPDPDLVIRTSGEKRLSNFLLWQIAYSELYFTRTLWPDFNSYKYKLALQDYVNRKRRFGGD